MITHHRGRGRGQQPLTIANRGEALVAALNRGVEVREPPTKKVRCSDDQLAAVMSAVMPLLAAWRRDEQRPTAIPNTA